MKKIAIPDELPTKKKNTVKYNISIMYTSRWIRNSGLPIINITFRLRYIKLCTVKICML